MLIQQLPNELLEKIFRAVALITKNKRDVISCALVCQTWHLTACRVLYEDIEFKKADLLVDCLIQQKQNKGVFCNTLISDTKISETSLTPEKYEKLFFSLPNLHSVILQEVLLRYSNCGYELEQLRKNAKHIQHVKNITLETKIWGPLESKAFYDCVITFKNSLESLKLYSLKQLISTQDGLLKFLPEFTCLTKLEISNLKYRHQHCTLPELRMFSILRACPNLINFKLDNGHQEPEDDYDHLFDHSKLRYLDLKIPIITEQHINYMVKNITQLTYFKLKCTGPDDYIKKHWIEKIGPDYTDQFQKYLADIEKVDCTMDAVFDQSPDRIRSFMYGVIINKRSIPTHFSITAAEIISSSRQCMVLKKRGESIFIDQGMIIPISSMINTPLQSQSIIIPSILSEHEVHSYDINFRAQDINETTISSIRSNILDIVKDSFASLSNFNIRLRNIHMTRYHIRVCSDEIIHADDCDDDWSDPRSTKYLPSHRPTDSKKLAYVLLRRIRSAVEITSILNMLPNTKYLKLRECDFDLDNQHNLTLDLSSLHLRQLKLDISQFTSRNNIKKTIVLQIEESKSNRTTCFKWKIVSKKFKEMTFKAADANFSTSYKRLSSPSCNIITVKCHQMEQIILSAKLKSLEASFSNTLNLTHNG